MNGSPTYWYFREYLSYNPETGEFFSLRTGNAKYQYIKRGYAIIQIGDKKYLAHRLAWLMTYGEWPEGHLDHINGKKLDNRIANLRLATIAQNAQNRALDSRYLSKCIWFDNTKKKRLKRFCVRVQANGKRNHIGWFLTEEEAKAAAIEAILKLHSEYANLEKKGQAHGE